MKDKDIALNMVVYLNFDDIKCPVYISKIIFCKGCNLNHYNVVRVFGQTKSEYVPKVSYFNKVNSITC